MNLTAIIRLKEKIAISEEFTTRERDFVLESINTAIITESSRQMPDDLSKLPKLREQKT